MAAFLLMILFLLLGLVISFLLFWLLRIFDNYYAMKFEYWYKQRSIRKQFQKGYKTASNMTKIGYPRDQVLEYIPSGLKTKGAIQFFKDYKAMQDLVDS